MLAGVSSCDQQELVSESSQPKATDDATLLKEQMEKLNTRAADYNVAIVTTKTQFSFDLIQCKGDYIVDWGDGTITNKILYHKYTDMAAAHTILVYADFEGDRSMLYVDNEEIISLDISRSPSLRRLVIKNNRIRSIDLSKNSSLEEINAGGNHFESIDVSNNKALKNIYIGDCFITKIDVTMLPLLQNLEITSTKISELDISKNPRLSSLGCANTAIRNLDLTKAPELFTLWVNNLQLDTLDVSMKPDLSMIFCDESTINTLNIENSSKIRKIHCNDSKVSNIILSNNVPDLDGIQIAGTPLEQNLEKLTNLALALPNYSNTPYDGYITTSTPHISTLTYVLQNRGWEIIVR